MFKNTIKKKAIKLTVVLLDTEDEFELDVENWTLI